MGALPQDTPAGSPASYDAVLLGAHLATGIAAAALARAGLRVVLVRVADEPDLPVGQSTVPYTAELFELLADRCALPELRDLALFSRVPAPLARSSGTKRCLSFAHHGGAGRHTEDLQFVVPSEHEEWHPHRPGLDQWAVDLAARAGAAVLDCAHPPALHLDDATGTWTVQLTSSARPVQQPLTTGFLVVGSSTRDPDWLAAAGARWQDEAGPWTSIHAHLATRAVPDGGTACRPAPAVQHALGWADGTTLVACHDGLVQIAPLGPGDGPAGGGTTAVSLTVDSGAVDTSSSVVDLLRALARGNPVLTTLADQTTGVLREARRPAFGAVHPGEDRPVLFLERAAAHAPQLLSRDITETLEVLCRVLPPTTRALLAGQAPDVAALAGAQRQIGAAHRRWVDTALRCRRSWPRWNAFLRVWLLWTIMGALSIKRERLAGPADGWAALDARPDDAHWYAPPQALASLVADATGHLGVPVDQRCDVDAVFARLRRDRIVPPLFDFGDPRARSYRLTLLRRMRMLLWATCTGRADLKRLLTSDNVTGRVRAGVPQPS